MISDLFLLFFCIFSLLILLVVPFKLIKWIFKKKSRISKALFALLIVWIIAIIIKSPLFSKMEFIQSNVYPDLYLIQNPISDRDSINSQIKEMVTHKMNSEFIGNESKYKRQGHPGGGTGTDIDIYYSIRFYKYYSSWGSSPLGEAGTAHFLDNEEDPGGFSSELLDYYEKYRIARFSVHFCENDTINYYGTLDYYQDGEVVKSDTLINKCKTEKQQFFRRPVAQ